VRLRPALIAAACGLLLASCDTGDGKQLQPFDPADVPATTIAAVVDTGAIGSASDDMSETESEFRAPFQLSAPWLAGGIVDSRYTCDGVDVAPALSWAAVPEGTVEIAIALVDDSVVSDGQPFVHWLIAGLDPAEIAVAEGDVPSGAVQALNFFGDVGYGGPCPPPGDEPHLYRLTAYALNQPLGLADGTPAGDFLDAIATAVIGSTDLTATYAR
jgi:Raf kinase inhibitor-like YbhB/YbcL family protein